MKLSKLFEELTSLPPELREAFIKGFSILEEVIGEMVTKDEFRELKQIVQELAERVNELAEAQKRTEQRVNELAEAQKKSEERLTRLEITVAELVEAQKKTEQRVNELVEAQKKSEERLTRLEITVAELIEAQKKSEERLTRLEVTVGELIEAQKRTEEEIRRLGEDVRKLWWGLDDLRKQVGGLSHTVGYTLEDRAINGLPKYLKKRYKIIVKRIDRRYISIDGKKFQINIYIEGKRGDKDIILMGEAKTEPSRKEIEDFLKVIRIIEGKIKGVKPLLVYYSIQDEIKEIAEKEGILLIPSFVLPI